MRILFSINSMNCGGAERVVSILANKFASEGHKTAIVVQEWPESFYELNPQVVYINIPKSKQRQNVMFYRIKMLRREIQKFSPDIVVSFLADHNIVTALACLGLKTQLIVSERNDPAKRPEKKMMRILRNLSYNLADGYVFQTPEARKYFKYAIQKSSIVIINPFDTKNMPSVYSGARSPHIAVVNRLVKQKRVDNIIYAFARLYSRYPEYELDILGDGPEREYLMQLAKQLSVEKRVHFHGRVDNVLDVIRKMQLFVLASDFEGMPNTLIEAMCMGLACISTDCPVGGPRMLIEHMKNGYLIGINDQNQIYEAMCHLIGNHALIEQISKEAVTLREKVDIDVVFGQWVEYIHSVRGTGK